MFIIIVFWLASDRPVDLFFSCPLYFFPYSRLSFVCFCILFHSCGSHARMFGKTLVHEYPISYSHTEWYYFFSDIATTRARRESDTRW